MNQLLKSVHDNHAHISYASWIFTLERKYCYHTDYNNNNNEWYVKCHIVMEDAEVLIHYEAVACCTANQVIDSSSYNISQ